MSEEKIIPEIGSYNEFTERNGLDQNSTQTRNEYTVALIALRETIAAQRGVDVVELHTNSHAASQEAA